jgi:hypothetical protein
MRGTKAKMLRRAAKGAFMGKEGRIKAINKRATEVRHETGEGGYNISYLITHTRRWVDGWQGLYRHLKGAYKNGRIPRSEKA